MKINLNIEAEVKIYPAKGKHENLLANASLTFRFENGQYFSISGFSIWKSKYDGQPNVQMPRKAGFRFCTFESNLWKILSKEILNKYDYYTIEPVI
jgi:hypothetical protein